MSYGRAGVRLEVKGGVSPCAWSVLTASTNTEMLWLYCDSFNVLSDTGKLFPGNGTYWGTSTLSEAYHNRLDAAFVPNHAEAGA